MGQPLQLTNPVFQNRHLTVVIWRKRGGIDALQNGHAALIIDTVGFRVNLDDDYVSWLSTGTGNLFKNRAATSTFLDDAENWGGTEVGDHGYHMPNRWVALKGMDVRRMRDAWEQMKGKERAHWKMLDKNCATAVARILKAGGGDDFATAHKKQLTWWPTDVIKYAKSMGANVVLTSDDQGLGNAAGAGH